MTRKATKAQVARKRELERRNNFRIFGCVICRKSTPGFGNNARPIADGDCCNTCNADIVFPVRLKEWGRAWRKMQRTGDA